MSDLIKRSDAIKKLRDNGRFIQTDAYPCDCACDIIESIPSAERKGEWILESGKIASFWVCSECDFSATAADEINDIKYFNYCPNCGADMRGEQDG